MARFTLTINCDNADFDDTEMAIAEILQDTAKQIVHGDITGGPWRLRDINGNHVGEARYEEAIG